MTNQFDIPFESDPLAGITAVEFLRIGRNNGLLKSKLIEDIVNVMAAFARYQCARNRESLKEKLGEDFYSEIESAYEIENIK